MDALYTPCMRCGLLGFFNIFCAHLSKKKKKERCPISKECHKGHKSLPFVKQSQKEG